jgi:hypothetical protein
MPFDGQRMIYGGFAPLLDLWRSTSELLRLTLCALGARRAAQFRELRIFLAIHGRLTEPEPFGQVANTTRGDPAPQGC